MAPRNALKDESGATVADRCVTFTGRFAPQFNRRNRRRSCAPALRADERLCDRRAHDDLERENDQSDRERDQTGAIGVLARVRLRQFAIKNRPVVGTVQKHRHQEREKQEFAALGRHQPRHADVETHDAAGETVHRNWG